MLLEYAMLVAGVKAEASGDSLDTPPEGCVTLFESGTETNGSWNPEEVFPPTLPGAPPGLFSSPRHHRPPCFSSALLFPFKLLAKRGFAQGYFLHPGIIALSALAARSPSRSSCLRSSARAIFFAPASSPLPVQAACEASPPGLCPSPPS